jgi:hypothetical protein
VETLNHDTSRFPGSDPPAAVARAGDEFADVFLVLTVLFIGLAMFDLIMKRPVPIGTASGGY